MSNELLEQFLRLERQHLIRHVHAAAYAMPDWTWISTFILHRDVDAAQAWSQEVVERHGESVRFAVYECEGTPCYDGGRGMDRARWPPDNVSQK